MAVAVTKPSEAGGRADDVRALKFRLRKLSFSGNYATGGETVTAKVLGLKRISACVPLDSFIRAANGVTGVFPVFDVASNGEQVVIRALEDAAGAAGTTVGQEKTNAEAYVANSELDVLFLGY